MFITHFKMIDHPFAKSVGTDGIFQDERISQGLARLTFLATYCTVALIVGEAGIGKSTLLRLFMDSLGKNRFHPVYIHLTHLRPLSLLKILVNALGEVPARGKEKVMLQILNKAKSSDLTTILLIDEAHLLDPDVLIDLRLLISSANESLSPLKIVLCGHPLIKKEIMRSCHEALLQRITVSYHIPPMTPNQTSQYIDFQIRRVMGSEKIFEPEVKNQIHEYTRGIPRLINNLATACLMNAAANNQPKVNATIFTQTLNEFQLF
jgi:general secretion pathway protein A